MSNKPQANKNNPPANPNQGSREQYQRHITGDIHVRGEIEAKLPPSLIEKRDTERHEDNTREGKKVVIERLTLLAVVVYAGITFWQGWLIRTSNQINREGMVSVQRAMVNAQTIMAIPIQDSLSKKIVSFHFYIPWENSGATQTRYAKTYSGWNISEPNDSTFSKSRSSDTTPLVLGPKVTLTSGEMQIHPEIIETIQKETGPSRPIRLFFWGWIRYNDVFKDTAPHLTEVCRELTGVNGDLSALSSQFQLIYTLCPQHNCSDDECKDYETMARLPVAQPATHN